MIPTRITINGEASGKLHVSDVEPRAHDKPGTGDETSMFRRGRVNRIPSLRTRLKQRGQIRTRAQISAPSPTMLILRFSRRA